MTERETDREMVEDVTRLGVRAAVLLRGSDAPEGGPGDPGVGPRRAAGRRAARAVLRPCSGSARSSWTCSTSSTSCYGLEGQLDYQIQEYGFDSLKDDLQEINGSLTRIGERFDLDELRHAI